MAKCNQLSIDVVGLYKAVQDACIVLIKKTAEEIKVLFASYIMADGAGRDHWRENAGKEFKIIETKLTDEQVEVILGMPPNFASDAWVDNYLAQIMVALYGNHPPLQTKPGQVTFHDQMEDKRPSEAKSVWDLPASYNWDSRNPEAWLKNTFREVETHFKDGVNALFGNINFYDYVYVN